MVSVDDPDTNKKFAETHEADYPILSDPGRNVANAYGVLGQQTPTARARRWTFYAGPDHKIVFIEKIFTAEKDKFHFRQRQAQKSRTERHNLHSACLFDVGPATAGEDMVAKLTELAFRRR